MIKDTYHILEMWAAQMTQELAQKFALRGGSIVAQVQRKLLLVHITYKQRETK